MSLSEGLSASNFRKNWSDGYLGSLVTWMVCEFAWKGFESQSSFVFHDFADRHHSPAGLNAWNVWAGPLFAGRDIVSSFSKAVFTCDRAPVGVNPRSQQACAGPRNAYKKLSSPPHPRLSNQAKIQSEHLYCRQLLAEAALCPDPQEPK